MASVYLSKYSSRADLCVYETRYENDADLCVFVVNDKIQAYGDEKWFYVDNESGADICVYMTERESEADLKIYFVENEAQAGWRKSHSWSGRIG